MSKSLQKSLKQVPILTFKSRKVFKSNYIFIPVLCFILLGCSNSVAKKTIPGKNYDEVLVLKKTVEEQQNLLLNLQALTADQMLRSNELEQAIPPRDLLESLQNGFGELRKKSNLLEKQLAALQQNVANSAKKNKLTKPVETDLPKNQKQLLRGLISLQAGNPDQAVEHLQKILKQKKSSQLKGEILLAVAHSFLAQGHAKQAAAHYGTFLREYPKSRYVPQALYFLGDAMLKLGEQKKQKVIWKELIKKYPKSNFAKRTK